VPTGRGHAPDAQGCCPPSLIRSNKAFHVPGRGRRESSPARVQQGRHAPGTAPLASAGTALAPVGAPALRTRRSRSPVPPQSRPLPRPPTPPAGCWQWDAPWGCGGEGAALRQAPPAAECPPCALAGPPPAPQLLPGDASFYSLPPPPPDPEPPAPSPSPSPQAVCWPSGWH
jgi:hypothetical protein